MSAIIPNNENINTTKKKKMLISIIYHHPGLGSNRFRYLYTILENFMKNYTDYYCVVSVETNSRESVSEIMNTFYNDILMFKIKIKIHKGLTHPYNLAKMHRKLFFKEINNYDYFMYIEDDMFIPYKNFQDYIQKYDIFQEWNKSSHQKPQYIPGFVRVETMNNEWYNTDNSVIQVIKPNDVIKIADRNFIMINNPYHAFWILSQETLKSAICNNPNRFIAVKDDMYIREKMASFPREELQYTQLVELDESYKIKNTCYAQHLGNNYVNSSGGFGSIKINDLVKIEA